MTRISAGGVAGVEAHAARKNARRNAMKRGAKLMEDPPCAERTPLGSRSGPGGAKRPGEPPRRGGQSQPEDRESQDRRRREGLGGEEEAPRQRGHAECP